MKYILISLKTGKIYNYKGNGDFHCKEGSISKEDIEDQSQLSLKTNKNVLFLKTTPNNYDYSLKIKRGAQIILSKDLGYILARTRLNRESVVLEAGGGSGAATCFFASLVKKVITYEIKPEHFEIILENVSTYGHTNVEVKSGDLADHICNEKEYDLLLLDMPEPIRIFQTKNILGLKNSGYVVCYLPSINQIQDLIVYLSENEPQFYVEEVTEVNLRHWKIRENISRPEHKKEIDHTAFLVFIRKL